MPAALRKIVKEMCGQYKILPKVRGSGNNKMIVLVKSRVTFVPDHWQNVVNIAITLAHTTDGKGYVNGPIAKSAIGAPDRRAVPKPGDIVGDKAQPLPAENVGHKMLLSMGWTPGASLGSSQAGETAIKEPLQVTVRSKRRGLGAE
ncbi:G patch domain-containing protein 2 [Phlyctochytrium bullatum]|nr:G patch domain-containing protein 2 [Phlyctochytrium bullatum]